MDGPSTISPGIAAAAESPARLERELAQRLLRDLFDQAPTIIFGNSLLFVINLAFYWQHLSTQLLLTWSSLILLSTGLRAASMYAFQNDPTRLSTETWGRLFTIASAVLGGSWAVLGVAVVLTTTPDLSVIAIISTAGVVGGSTATSSASPQSFRALAGMTLVPVATAALLTDHPTYQVVGLLYICYLVVLARASNRIFRSLKQSVVFGIRNESLVENLAEQSRVDSLTGLLNRRALNQGFETAWKAGIKEDHAVGLVLCDVDFFKQYNDSLGHLQGDDCLQQIAGAIASVTRADDLTTARFGGEEFAVLVPDCSAETLEAIAQRIHRAVLQLRIPHPGSSIGEIVTVSVGTSVLHPKPSQPINELIRTADNALYRAKADGRNRVCAAH